MKTHILLIITLLSILVTACYKDNELKNSIFIYDPENRDLPAYSEWGYNTFGAYYDREIFVSNNKLVPAKVIVTATDFSFLLEGQKGTSRYNSTLPDMGMSFTLSSFKATSYADLAQLNDSTINLLNPDCVVSVTIEEKKHSANIIEGKLIFNRVQILQVDKKQVEAILSGHFEFKAIINDKPITISDGRFDVGIGSDNFYRN